MPHELQAAPPGIYRQRGASSLQRLFRTHFPEFAADYDAHYARRLGRARLPRITRAVERFLECGDYSKGVARIRCTNPECRAEYFRPISCKVFHRCPSCSQKRTLLFGEYMNQRLLLRLPHRQMVFTFPKLLRSFFRHHRIPHPAATGSPVAPPARSFDDTCHLVAGESGPCNGTGTSCISSGAPAWNLSAPPGNTKPCRIEEEIMKARWCMRLWTGRRLATDAIVREPLPQRVPTLRGGRYTALVRVGGRARLPHAQEPKHLPQRRVREKLSDRQAAG